MSARISSLSIATVATFANIDTNSVSFYGVHDDDDRRITLAEMRALVGQNLGVLAHSNTNQSINGTYINYETTIYDPDSWRIGVNSVVCQIPSDHISHVRVLINQENASTTSWQRSYPHVNGVNAVPLPIVGNDTNITRAYHCVSAPIPVNSGDIIQVYGDGGLAYTKSGYSVTWVAVLPWNYTR